MSTKVVKPCTFTLSRPSNEIKKLFEDHGFTYTEKLSEADVVVFGGGADISPLLYGERRLSTTQTNIEADMKDIQSLRNANKNARFVGICRGAQFLNVMVGGGKLYQHVTSHAVADGHAMYPLSVAGHLIEIEGLMVNSTHHQMMIPHPSGSILFGASEATIRQTFNSRETYSMNDLNKEDHVDPEVIVYPQSGCLCWQPHPEFDNAGKEHRELFFDTLETYLLSTDEIKALRFNKPLPPSNTTTDAPFEHKHMMC